MNCTTEFLAKSLVGAGVLLALPAALAVLLGFFAMANSLPHIHLAEIFRTAGLMAFCLFGLFLLFRTICFVRRSNGASTPAYLWPIVTVYLLILIAFGTYWLFNTYSLSRDGESRSWGGDEIEPGILVIPAIALLVPIWAVILSATLWIRYTCDPAVRSVTVSGDLRARRG
ncbi:MAG: hypothetical protein V4710_24680 [Verrucomicrobiota bacterium]